VKSEFRLFCVVAVLFNKSTPTIRDFSENRKSIEDSVRDKKSQLFPLLSNQQLTVR
jgi:hypothetical protein